MTTKVQTRVQPPEQAIIRKLSEEHVPRKKEIYKTLALFCTPKEASRLQKTCRRLHGVFQDKIDQVHQSIFFEPKIRQHFHPKRKAESDPIDLRYTMPAKDIRIVDFFNTSKKIQDIVQKGFPGWDKNKLYTLLKDVAFEGVYNAVTASRFAEYQKLASAIVASPVAADISMEDLTDLLIMTRGSDSRQSFQSRSRRMQSVLLSSAAWQARQGEYSACAKRVVELWTSLYQEEKTELINSFAALII